MPAILVWLLIVLCHGYYEIFLSYRAVGHYKMSGSRCQITLNWCAMLPSDGEAGPVVQVHRRSKVWVQEFTLPPPAVESGALDFLSVIIGGLEEMTSKLLSSSDILRLRLIVVPIQPAHLPPTPKPAM